MTQVKVQRRELVSQVCSRTKQRSGERKHTVRSSNGRASWMLASVAWRSFSSTSICASVSFALAICISRRRGNVFFFFGNWSKSEKQVHKKNDGKRTALVSNVSMALTCSVTSYVTGLKSRRIFSASSTIALFFRTER